MLGIYTWSVLITGIFFTSFGVFAYLNNKRELPNRLFGLLSLAFAIWCYAWFALLFVKEDVGSAYFWAKILNLGATLIPIFYMHWILSVLNLAQKKKYLIIGGYLLTFLFIIFNHSDFFIEGVHQALFFPFWPTPGPLYKWFLLFGYLGIAGYAFIELIKESFKASGEKKYQIVFIRLGSVDIHNISYTEIEKNIDDQILRFNIVGIKTSQVIICINFVSIILLCYFLAFSLFLF